MEGLLAGNEALGNTTRATVFHEISSINLTAVQSSVSKRIIKKMCDSSATLTLIFCTYLFLYVVKDAKG